METPAHPVPTDSLALYDRIASAYHRWWAPVIEPAALRLLDLSAAAVDDDPEAVLVDVGAGTGPLVRAAVARWPEVRAIAVDPSTAMLAIGRAEAEATLDQSAHRRLTWMAGAAEALPFEDGSVGVVLSSFVLPYLRSRIAAFREMYRIVRPGGIVALVTWLDDDRPFEPTRLCGELLDELHIEPPRSRESAPLRSVPSAAASLRRAGFQAVKARAGLVDYQWTSDAFRHWSNVLVIEDPELAASVDDVALGRLEQLWPERLERLADEDFRYRNLVAYVTGRRPR